ncbi:hypothetical protein Syun_017596 [Stephania yunnanensis]|uniref:Beta-galactosidase n=1 Tax=Stephania yunnanensis TaxID=152371 RepID=A0AAP0P3I4_9MAGN
MQKLTAKIVDMVKPEKLYASQGGPIILSQPYIKWAASMATSLDTGVPWVMCQQSDAPDPVISAAQDKFTTSSTISFGPTDDRNMAFPSLSFPDSNVRDTPLMIYKEPHFIPTFEYLHAWATGCYYEGEVSGHLERTGKRVSYFLPNGVALGVLAVATRRCEIDLCEESKIKIVAPASYPIITFGPLLSPTAVLVSLSHAIGYLLELVLFLLVRWDDMLMKAAGKDCTSGAVSLLGFSAIFSAILLAQESIYGQMAAYMKESGEGFLREYETGNLVFSTDVEGNGLDVCDRCHVSCLLHIGLDRRWSGSVPGRYLALYLVGDRSEGTREYALSLGCCPQMENQKRFKAAL